MRPKLSSKIPLNKFRKNGTITIENTKYKILNKHDEGNFAKIYVLENIATSRCFACKLEKPSFLYEYFVGRRVQEEFRVRRSPRMPPLNLKTPSTNSSPEDDYDNFYLTSVSHYIYDNASLIFSEFYSRGTLLDMINHMHKPHSSINYKEKISIAAFYTYHLTKIVQKFHQHHLIHGDIKPDNFLLNNREGCLSNLLDNIDQDHYKVTVPKIESDTNRKMRPLIITDFGRTIDCPVLNDLHGSDPKHYKFTQPSKTENFECTEMQQNPPQPYCYEIDLYALAGTIHVLIFNEYMTTKKVLNQVKPVKNFPRYLSKEWSEIFKLLLNSKNSDSKTPNLAIFGKILALLEKIDTVEGIKFSKFLKN